MELVGAIGLEPTTPTMSRWCSNQLSYAPTKLCILPFSRTGRKETWASLHAERVSSSAPALALPLHDFRMRPRILPFLAKQSCITAQAHNVLA